MPQAIPKGLHSVTPSLSVDGCAEAIAFYKEAFGAEELNRTPDPSGKKIWHAAIAIGDSQVFLNDVFPEMGGGAVTAHLWIYSDHVDQMFKRAVDAGCTVRMPLDDTFWGDRLGTVSDRWGNTWSLAQHIKDMSPAEIKAAGDAFAAKMKR